ncbi:pleckstrin homology domain-containing family G member 7 [Rhinophrynus dorsalis]
MEEPVHVFFSIMDEEEFNSTEYNIKDGNDRICELIDTPIETQTIKTESNIKDMHMYMDNQKSTKENIHRRGHHVPPLIIMIPPKEADGDYSTPFQFDRQAPARISTSPTLRRLRKSATGHFMPLQDFFDTSKFPTHKENTVLETSPGHHCPSPPWSQKYAMSPSPSSSLSPLVLSSPEEEEFVVPEVIEENMNDGLSEDPAVHSTYAEEKALEGPEDNHTDVPTKENPIDDDTEKLCTQIKEFHQSRLFERRRSSVVLSLPGLEVFPGDLLVSDGASDYIHHSSWFPNADAKKPKWPFSKKGSIMKGKQKQVSDLENCLSTIKIPEFTEYEFYNLKDKTWNEFISMHPTVNNETAHKSNRKRLESVWELFTSECTYLLDHLLVLKLVFWDTLKYLQNNDCLLDVDLVRLFANLEELKQESQNFASSLLNTIKGRELGCKDSSSVSLAELLTKYSKESFRLNLQVYCLNYTSAVVYLESIKQRDDFTAYLKWCEQHEHCKRLHLPDLLVAPLHRLTRYPLLLKNIWKRSTDTAEKFAINSIKEKVESSIRDLEGKVKWLDKSQKFKQLQEVIVWPSLWERDKRFFVPEGLKHYFKDTNVESMLSSPNRDLLHEGRLILTESTRLLDVYVFLFDDFLLITKIKKNKRKSTNFETALMYQSLHPALQSVMKDGGYCKVLDQPIPLDRLSLKTIDQFHVTVYGMRNAFLIQHENRYQQCIAAFIFQAQTESEKKTWMSQIETAVSCYTETRESKRCSVLCQPSESTEI